MRTDRLIRAALAMAICFGIGLYSARASDRSRSAPQASTSPAVVQMAGDQLVFNPPTIVIRRGQTVEWQNRSNQLHNIVDDAAKAASAADVEMPKGATTFDSGLMKPGQTFMHRFTVRGTYRYVCTMHEMQGMKGEIVVK